MSNRPLTHYLVRIILLLLPVAGCDRQSASQSVSDIGSASPPPLASAREQLDPAAGVTNKKGDVDQPTKDRFVQSMRSSIESFCGDCHVNPQPSSSPISEWEMEVAQGFRLYEESGRTDLTVPDKDDVLKFFEYQANEHLQFAATVEKSVPKNQSFSQTTVQTEKRYPPGITNIRWLDIGIHDSPALVFCDIGTGQVKAHWPQVKGSPTEVVSTLFQPVHAETCDLNGDGLTDLVVADIGEFDANDSDMGRVVWLQRDQANGKFNKVVLVDELSRVSDVQVGDFDRDGDEDVIVAAFGWRRSGRILLLNNQGTNGDGTMEFKQVTVDERHGPIQLLPIDLNDDGHLDFVGLIGQEHESVEAFINDGNATFSPQVLWHAPDPAYGSCGIQLADIDGDGDTDVLYANGDSFDRGAKPFHSIQWLENEGGYPFKHHHLCNMPGVLAAKAADFDGDGDLDIVGGSLIPAAPEGGELDLDKTASLVLLTQTNPSTFVQSAIEVGVHEHLSVEIGDFNDDGQVDLATGHFMRDKRGNKPDLSVWWNQH